jgi:hypothetical protein
MVGSLKRKRECVGAWIDVDDIAGMTGEAKYIEDVYDIVKDISQLKGDEIRLDARMISSRTREDTSRLVCSIGRGRKRISRMSSFGDPEICRRVNERARVFPVEVWMEVFGHLDGRDLVAVGETCVHWARMLSDDGAVVGDIWKKAKEMSIRGTMSKLERIRDERRSKVYSMLEVAAEVCEVKHYSAYVYG